LALAILAGIVVCPLVSVATSYGLHAAFSEELPFSSARSWLPYLSALAVLGAGSGTTWVLSGHAKPSFLRYWLRSAVILVPFSPSLNITAFEANAISWILSILFVAVALGGVLALGGRALDGSFGGSDAA
jgi:hypothetical protein